jgi:hypothetical protein
LPLLLLGVEHHTCVKGHPQYCTVVVAMIVAHRAWQLLTWWLF